MQVSVDGLDSEVVYHVLLHVKSVDKMRYSFINNKWCAQEETTITPLKKEWLLFKHPSSPRTGDYWIEVPVDFSSTKIAQYYGETQNGNVKYKWGRGYRE